jgi:hypothetical protein
MPLIRIKENPRISAIPHINHHPVPDEFLFA